MATLIAIPVAIVIALARPFRSAKVANARKSRTPMAHDADEVTKAAPAAGADATERSILELARPHRNLLWLYSAYALASLCAAPIVFVPLYFKFHTLRYRLDEEGISASWGILFRREIHLTYKRIQDIHVRRNLIERWLGIATVQVQTASGGSSAELALEGMRDHDAVREFLYRRMRGHELANARPGGAAHPGAAGSSTSTEVASNESASGGDAELVQLLRSLHSELEAIRRAVETRKS